MLAELEDMDTADPNFMEKLDKLRIAVLTHARFEERYEFERLRDQLSDAQNNVLAAAVRAAQAVAPTHPHPGTESAKKNIALGPMVAIVDRTRDLIRKAMNIMSAHVRTDESGARS
ncbi:hypothetical protein [Actinomadura sp. HBU206391]|uniref:hypothetical protein n=1 Tax=Actinomadura sp. HBU206391 TaxID=2731692 RepID=UPI00164F008C|nr:hypothetical protein [Actinomadura sp. HBU206391]MBC6461202.1 hypothetical protein [Actinomadura sp. HBU206391]